MACSVTTTKSSSLLPYHDAAFYWCRIDLESLSFCAFNKIFRITDELILELLYKSIQVRIVNNLIEARICPSDTVVKNSEATNHWVSVNCITQATMTFIVVVFVILLRTFRSDLHLRSPHTCHRHRH